jgi:hypothetical protein
MQCSKQRSEDVDAEFQSCHTMSCRVLGVWFPWLTFHLMSASYSYAMHARDHIGPWDALLNLPAPLPAHYELEYAVPVPVAISVLRALPSAFKHLSYLNHAIEIRYVAKDQVYMSNEYQDDQIHITLCLYGRDQHKREE